MARQEYTLSDFYLYLKLGIWQTGMVEGWGLTRKVDVYPDGKTNKGCIVIKQPDEYKKEGITKTELQIGLNLLDMYPLDVQQTSKNNNKYKIYNYLIIISECRLKGTFDEQIYYLKVTNYQTLEQFRKIINDGAQARKSNWSPIKPKHRVSRFDSSPLNSVRRK
ncbi:MAG: hypothetical protein ACK5KL_05220 [Dysgonomonas sp.]